MNECPRCGLMACDRSPDGCKKALLRVGELGVGPPSPSTVRSLAVYGSSDDCIEVEGPGIGEEFYLKGGDESPDYLAFSDGTVLRVQYGVGDKGVWEIRPMVNGSATCSHKAWTCEDRDYSDRVTLEGDLSWVAHGTGFERFKRRG